MMTWKIGGHGCRVLRNWARVQSAKIVGNTVILFELVLNKKERFFAVGCYFPLPDKEGVVQQMVEQAMRDKPTCFMVLPQAMRGARPGVCVAPLPDATPSQH